MGKACLSYREGYSILLVCQLRFDPFDQRDIARIVAQLLIEVILFVFQNTAQKLRKVFRGIGNH